MDEVIEEIDVFLSSNVSSKLHVFQFPSGFSPLSDDRSALMNIKVKSESHKFQMEMGIDTNSPNYDHLKSEQLVFIADDENDPFFPTKYVNRLVLESDELKPSVIQFAVGVMKSNCKELHVSPINSIIHFRQNFEYFDKKRRCTRNLTRQPGDFDVPVNVSTIDNNDIRDDEIRRIIPRFERPDEERFKRARENSFSFLSQKLYSEPWVDIEINFHDSSISLIEKQALIYNHPRNSNSCGYHSKYDQEVQSANNFHLNVNSSLFCDESLKSVLEFNFSEPRTDHCISYLGKLNSLPLNVKIRTIMLNAKVVSFKHVQEILGDSIDAATIIRKLQEYSMLVQGNWIVKSEVLYPKESGTVSISPVTGIPIEMLCRARDLILWSFTQEFSLSRVDLINKTKISAEEVFFILNEVAQLNKTTKLWDFTLPRDDIFIQKYPDIVQRQALLWEARYVQLNKANTAKSKKSLESSKKHIKQENIISSSTKRATDEHFDPISAVKYDPDVQLVKVKKSRRHS